MKRESAPVSKDETKELIDLFDRATLDFKGDLHHLETAIGALLVGRQLGWKPLLLIHDKRTIKRFEKDLGIKSIRDYMPEIGKHADKSLAWNLVQKVSSFWKAVKGEITGIRTSTIQ